MTHTKNHTKGQRIALSCLIVIVLILIYLNLTVSP